MLSEYLYSSIKIAIWMKLIFNWIFLNENGNLLVVAILIQQQQQPPDS